MPAGKPIKRTAEERAKLPPSKRGAHNTKPPVPLKRELCGATKPNKEKCGLPAGYGTDHPGKGPCKHHFGNTAGVVRGVAIDDGKDVIATLRGMGVEMDIDPIDALVWEVRNSAGHVAWRRSIIATWETRDKKGDFIPLTAEQENFYAAYLEERKQLVYAARMAEAAGVQQRAITISEKQSVMLADAVEAILIGLGLSERQKELVPEIVPPTLRAIAMRVPLLEELVSTDPDINEAWIERNR
jgi:hypothetical protein